MQNSVVKNVLVALVLVVLCFVVGVQAAESAKTSAVIMAAVVGVAFLLWLGPRSWILIYLLPPLLTLFPLPGKLAELPLPFLASGGVLVYWFVMRSMGYVRFKWRALPLMDLLVLIVFGYMVASYLRHPVSIAMFGGDAEYVGGKEYAWAVLAAVHYLAISCVPCSYEQLRKVLSWGVKLSIAMALVVLLLRLAGFRGDVDISELGEASASTRVSMFRQLGVYGLYCLYGVYPLVRLLCSPLLLVGCVLSMGAIAMCGFRDQILANGIVVIVLAFVKRELWCLILVGLCAYGAILFLSNEGIVKRFPYGVQRCLSVVPGVEIEKEIRANAEHSKDWRIVMWKWALDKRTGYIQNYVWGDGFGQSVAEMRRDVISQMRGTARYGDQESFASTGIWHSGYITAIHRLGYVGMVLIAVVYAYGFVMLLRVCFALKGTSLFFPCVFFSVFYAGEPFVYFISAGTLITFFRGYIGLAFIKLFYCVAREQGLIKPWHFRQRYVPQVIREHGDELRAPR